MCGTHVSFARNKDVVDKQTKNVKRAETKTNKQKIKPTNPGRDSLPEQVSSWRVCSRQWVWIFSDTKMAGVFVVEWCVDFFGTKTAGVFVVE